MTFYTLSALINFITSSIFGIIIISKGRDSKNISFFIFCFFIAFWSIAYYFWQIANTAEVALFWVRILMIGAIFIPVVYLYFVYALVELLEKKKKFLIFSCFLFFIFLLADFTPYFISHVGPILNFKFWPRAGFIFSLFLFVWLFYVVYSNYLLFQKYKISTGILRLQIKYVMIGMWIGFIGGITNYFLWYKILIPPFGNILVSIYIIAVAIAVLKHHLFNIKIIATELLVFSIWIATLIEFLFEDSLRGRLLAGGSFVFMVIAGILLIRSVIKEVKQKEKIEELSKYKSELLSIVSHQIRNPLAVVRGYASLIGDNTISDPLKIRETFLKIKAATDKLLDLLNNLLDFGHIEDGKMHYDFQKIDLNKMLKETIDDFSFLAQQKNLEITFEPVNGDMFISGDFYKLTQVFRNLVDNAIKYTPFGWIKIVIDRRPMTDDKQQEKESVLITISDSGRGMSKELASNLFQKFTRGGDEKQVLGSGLGLFICKEIIEAHNGQIWAESDGEGKGSRFCVKLNALSKLNFDN